MTIIELKKMKQGRWNGTMNRKIIQTEGFNTVPELTLTC
jgi:hypothetical protein